MAAATESIVVAVATSDSAEPLLSSAAIDDAETQFAAAVVAEVKILGFPIESGPHL